MAMATPNKVNASVLNPSIVDQVTVIYLWYMPSKPKEKKKKKTAQLRVCIQIKEEKSQLHRVGGKGVETSGRRQYVNDLPWPSLLLESDRIKNQARSVVDLSTPTKKRKRKDRIDLKCPLAMSCLLIVAHIS